jgi:hypothetical protein
MGKQIMNQDKRPAYAPRCFGLASLFGADEDICGQCRAAAECGPIAKDNLTELGKLIDVSHVGSMHFIAEPKKPEASPVQALPKPDPSAAPIRCYGAATPKEMDQINAILAEVGDIPEPDDLPSAALSNNTAPGPKKPETATVPALPKPKPKPSSVETGSSGFAKYAESGRLEAALYAVCVEPEPEEALLERYQSLFSDDSALSLDQVALADKIAAELTKRGKPPSERGVTAFDGDTCRNNKRAKFKSNLLQVHDQQWIQARHPGHLTKGEAWGGIYADIFAPGPFDRGRAMKIAEDKHGMDEKAKCLNLSLSQQRELAVLFGETEKNRRFAARAKELRKARNDQERLLQVKRDAVDIKARLIRYKEGNRRRKLNVEVYTNVWMALELSKDSDNYLIETMRVYEELTGESVSKPLMQRRIGILKDALNN